MILDDKEIQYPVVMTTYHPRWYGRLLIRLSQLSLDLAYWRGREVLTMFSDSTTTSESTDGGMTWKPR